MNTIRQEFSTIERRVWSVVLVLAIMGAVFAVRHIKAKLEMK